jgi:hypothetical protein
VKMHAEVEIARPWIEDHYWRKIVESKNKSCGKMK